MPRLTIGIHRRSERRQEATHTRVGVHGRLLALAIVLAFASAATLSSRADAEALAIDRYDSAAPVLWRGGIAWPDFFGVHGATPGNAAHLLASFHAAGSLSYRYALDSGMGAGETRDTLAYGFEEINEQTPPMGPGDSEVPAPPIPYESAVVRRGVIGADGHVTPLQSCAAEDLFFFPGSSVSLAGATVAYDCAGPPPGVTTVPGKSPSAYLALSDLGNLGGVAQTAVNADGAFQLSGELLVYQTGEPFKPSQIIVENRTTHAVAYQVAQAANEERHVLALGADGTLVLLGEGTPKCGVANRVSEQAYPAEWFSPASPVAHQLGCFFDGALRPVNGQWLALAPGPRSAASLVLVTLVSGTRTTLAVLPNAGMFEPGGQPLAPAADFDGKQLAWTLQTCAGTALQFNADIASMSPGAPLSTRCPLAFHVPKHLRIGKNGTVRVGVSCPLGCKYASLSIAKPRALREEDLAFFSLPPSSKPTTETFRLTRGELAYLRRHRRVEITLVAEVSGLGDASAGAFRAHTTLSR